MTKNPGRSDGRGRAFFNEPDTAGLMHRAFTRSLGFDRADMNRPMIGILNTYSEMNNCHAHFPELVEAVKRGVWQAGGFPLEFPTISLGEIYLTPTSMLWRNLAAMDTEEMIRGNPMDGVVVLCGCDKTTPAALMGVASADLPAILVSGGPMLNGHWRGQTLGACTDCRRLTTEYRAGNLSDAGYAEVEENLARSRGHCMVMGTASTMNSMSEALGISLPGNGAIPAADSRRILLAERAGRRIVALAAEGVRAVTHPHSHKRWKMRLRCSARWAAARTRSYICRRWPAGWESICRWICSTRSVGARLCSPMSGPAGRIRWRIFSMPAASPRFCGSCCLCFTAMR